MYSKLRSWKFLFPWNLKIQLSRIDAFKGGRGVCVCVSRENDLSSMQERILEEYLKFNFEYCSTRCSPSSKNKQKETNSRHFRYYDGKTPSIGSLRYYCGSKRSLGDLSETCVHNHLLIVSVTRQSWKLEINKLILTQTRDNRFFVIVKLNASFSLKLSL